MWFAKRSWLVLLAAWSLIVAAHLGLATRSLDRPGVYYDEVFQAIPAKDLLRGAERTKIPVWNVEVLGVSVPYRTQLYMGALKSQLLVPSFALWGAEVSVLRVTTCIWALFGILLVMAWARRCLGTPEMLLVGALLASDATLLFVARHDWGSISLALVCKAAGLLLMTRWLAGDRTWYLVGAGVAFGLGIYNKVDFAISFAAAGLAAALTWPHAVPALLRQHYRALALAAAALLVVASPVLWTIPPMLSMTGGGHTDTLIQKLQAAHYSLDGSYLFRLIAVRGRFHEMAHIDDAPVSFLPLLALASCLTLGLLGWRRSAGPREKVGLFIAVWTVLSQAGLLLLPGFYRVHHQMNVYPLPHLAVAAAAVAIWCRCAGVSLGPRLIRAGVVAGFAALLAMGGIACLRTHALIERTGGRGYWSDSIFELARQVDRRPEMTVVSLDWGFHLPLAFLTEETPLFEPIFELPTARAKRGGWRWEGDASDLYVLHPPQLDLMGHGRPFLEALAALDPAVVEIRRFRDREGAVTALAIRILGPHRVVYRRRLSIELL